MTKLKLTAFSFTFLAFIITAVSCVKERDEVEQENTFTKAGIVMSGANEVPANTSAATGTIDYSYSKLSKTLSYKVTWSGLTDSLSLMHIHGLAPAGFIANPAQNIIVAALTPAQDGTAGNGIFPQRTSSHRLNFLKSGSISATLFVDGVAIKEADLLNGMYYLNIHSLAYTGGEIRAQIVF